MHSEVIGISHLLPYELFGGQVVFLYKLVAEEGVKAFFFAVLSGKIGFALTRSPFYGTDTMIIFRCKQEMKVVFDLEIKVERRYI